MELLLSFKYLCTKARAWLCSFPAYESLQSREETRNAAWLKEGWDVNVYNTGITDDNLQGYSRKKNKNKHSSSANANRHGYRQFFSVVLHLSYLKCYSPNTSAAFKLTSH